MKVKIINKSGYDLPSYATPLSAGFDLRAVLDVPLILAPMERVLIKTGIFIGLPQGYEAQVRPRSGLAMKYGITVLNAPGTIDADYTDEVGVILVNLGSEPFTVNSGERIAQMVIAKHEVAEWEEVAELKKTERKGGFGYSGIK